MKKATLVLGLLAAATSSAWAQSSVTMYGIMDVAARYSSNFSGTGSKYNVAPGGMSESRLGFNITEDLGGGLKAIANLEHRLKSDTGTVPQADFWRQSWVGIESADFGRVTLGRQYNVLFDIYTSTYASFKYSPYIEAFKPEIGLSMGARQDNMVKWAGAFGPVRGEVQISAGEGSTTAANKSIGGMLRYGAGAFSVGGGYLEVEDPFGKKVKGMTFGGAYTEGPWYINASWAQNKFDAGSMLQSGYTGALGVLLNLAGNSVKKRDMISVGAAYQLTTQFNLGAHYWHSTQTHQAVTWPGKSKGDFFAIVGDYAFSKRTDVYVEVDYSKFGGAVTLSNGATKRGNAMVGLRHRF